LPPREQNRNLFSKGCCGKKRIGSRTRDGEEVLKRVQKSAFGGKTGCALLRKKTHCCPK
jgi:hypothetical protein